MIETKLIEFLGGELDLYVGMEPPEQLTDYVLIDKTGSSRTNHIITSSIAIQSYGSSLYDAMVLNQSVEEAMQRFAELQDIIRVELDTDYNFTNTVTKQYRWQAVYSVTHY